MADVPQDLRKSLRDGGTTGRIRGRSATTAARHPTARSAPPCRAFPHRDLATATRFPSAAAGGGVPLDGDFAQATLQPAQLRIDFPEPRSDRRLDRPRDDRFERSCHIRCAGHDLPSEVRAKPITAVCGCPHNRCDFGDRSRPDPTRFLGPLPPRSGPPRNTPFRAMIYARCGLDPTTPMSPVRSARNRSGDPCEPGPPPSHPRFVAPSRRGALGAPGRLSADQGEVR